MSYLLEIIEDADQRNDAEVEAEEIDDQESLLNIYEE